MNPELQSVRSRHAALLEFPTLGATPETDWTVQEFGARTALERLCGIAADLAPEIRKAINCARAYLARADRLKENR